MYLADQSTGIVYGKPRSVVFIGTVPYGDVSFDCVPSEKVESNAVVTRNPVEFGADINDHMYLEPQKIQLQVIVSDTPMTLTETDIVTKSGSGVNTRASQAWEALLDIQGRRTPFHVVLGLQTLSDCVITSLSHERVAENSGALICDVELTQVILKTTQITALDRDILAPDVKTKAAPQDNGKIPPDTKKNPEPYERIYMGGFNI